MKIPEHNLHILDLYCNGGESSVWQAAPLCCLYPTHPTLLSTGCPNPRNIFSGRFLSNCWVWVDQKSSVSFVIQYLTGSLSCLLVSIHTGVIIVYQPHFPLHASILTMVKLYWRSLMDRVCSSSDSRARSLTDLLKGILHQIKVFSPKPHIFLGCGITWRFLSRNLSPGVLRRGDMGH